MDFISREISLLVSPPSMTQLSTVDRNSMQGVGVVSGHALHSPASQKHADRGDCGHPGQQLHATHLEDVSPAGARSYWHGVGPQPPADCSMSRPPSTEVFLSEQRVWLLLLWTTTTKLSFNQKIAKRSEKKQSAKNLPPRDHFHGKYGVDSCKTKTFENIFRRFCFSTWTTRPICKENSCWHGSWPLFLAVFRCFGWFTFASDTISNLFPPHQMLCDKDYLCVIFHVQWSGVQIVLILSRSCTQL